MHPAMSVPVSWSAGHARRPGLTAACARKPRGQFPALRIPWHGRSFAGLLCLQATSGTISGTIPLPLLPNIAVARHSPETLAAEAKCGYFASWIPCPQIVLFVLFREHFAAHCRDREQLHTSCQGDGDVKRG